VVSQISYIFLHKNRKISIERFHFCFTFEIHSEPENLDHNVYAVSSLYNVLRYSVIVSVLQKLLQDSVMAFFWFIVCFYTQTAVYFIELSREHPDAPLFLENGIDVLSVREFVRGFMGKTIEHQTTAKLCKLSFPTLHNSDIIMYT